MFKIEGYCFFNSSVEAEPIYSNSGSYFVALCTENRIYDFAKINLDHEDKLNFYGYIKYQGQMEKKVGDFKGVHLSIDNKVVEFSATNQNENDKSIKQLFRKFEQRPITLLRVFDLLSIDDYEQLLLVLKNSIDFVFENYAPQSFKAAQSITQNLFKNRGLNEEYEDFEGYIEFVEDKFLKETSRIRVSDIKDAFKRAQVQEHEDIQQRIKLSEEYEGRDTYVKDKVRILRLEFKKIFLVENAEIRKQLLIDFKNEMINSQAIFSSRGFHSLVNSYSQKLKDEFSFIPKHFLEDPENDQDRMIKLMILLNVPHKRKLAITWFSKDIENTDDAIYAYNILNTLKKFMEKSEFQMYLIKILPKYIKFKDRQLTTLILKNLK